MTEGSGRLTGYNIIRGLGDAARDVVCFTRNLAAPRDELIFDAAVLPAKAEAFKPVRPEDAQLILQAHDAYQKLVVSG